MLKLNLYNVTGCHNCPLLSFKYSTDSPIIDHKCYVTNEIVTSNVHNKAFHEGCPGTYVDIKEVVDSVNTKSEVKTIQKIRPVAKIVSCTDEDGFSIWDEIAYQCPICGKLIKHGYQGETACDACGTFYDWGNSKPTIEIAKTVKW